MEKQFLSSSGLHSGFDISLWILPEYTCEFLLGKQATCLKHLRMQTKAMHQKTPLMEHRLFALCCRFYLFAVGFISSWMLHLIPLWMGHYKVGGNRGENKLSVVVTGLAASHYPSLFLWINLTLSKDIILSSIRLGWSTAQHVLASLLCLCSELAGHKQARSRGCRTISRALDHPW